MRQWLNINCRPRARESKLGRWPPAGPAGSRAVVDPQQPSQVLEVRWTDAMSLERSAGKPVLRLDGRPRVSLAGTGTMWADRLDIYLRESANAAPSGPNGGSPLAGSVVPELIKAMGRVAIESPQLNGKVNQLEVKFDHGDASSNAGVAHSQIAATPISTVAPTAPAEPTATPCPCSAAWAGRPTARRTRSKG